MKLLELMTKELKKVNSNKIIWQKDGSKMSHIPSSKSTKSFWMDTTEVTLGQFKKYLKSSGYKNTKAIKKQISYIYRDKATAK